MDSKARIHAVSSKISITHHETRFSDGDPAGIVYFANYPMYCDEAFIKIAKRHGLDWGQRDMEFIIPIVEQKVSYNQPLRVGQDFSIATAIDHIGKRSFRSAHLIYTEFDDATHAIASGYISRAVVDPTTFQATPITDELQSALEQYQIDQEQWDRLRELFA